MKPIKTILLTVFYVFCFSFSSKAQVQAQTYLTAAQKYEEAAAKTSCPQNKKCYLDNADYLKKCAAALRTGSGVSMPGSAPSCQPVACPQDKNGNPTGGGAGGSGGGMSNGMQGGSALAGAGMFANEVAGSDNLSGGTKAGLILGSIGLGTAAEILSPGSADAVGAGFGLLSSIIGLFGHSQQHKREAEAQRQAEEQHKAQEAQKREQERQRIAAYEAEQQRQAELVAKQREYEALLQQQKENTYTAENWFGEALSPGLNSANRITMLTKALKKDATYLPALEQRGLLYYREAGDISKAAADFASAMQLNTKNAEVYLAAAEISYGRGQYDYAIQYYSQAFSLQSSIKTAENIEKRAFCFYRLKQYDSSLADYETALQLKPNDRHLLFQKAQTEFFADKFEKAKADFTRLVALDDNNKEYFYYKGFCEMNLKQYAAAIADLNIAVRIDYKYADAYYIRGYAKYQNNDFAGAKEDFTQSVWYSKNNPLFYYYRASSEFNLGDYAKAAKDAEDALAFSPEFKDAFNLFAETQIKLNEGNTALQPWFDYCKVNQGKLSNFYYHMATFYSATNNKSVSLDWFEKAVKSGFNDFTYAQSDPLLSNVKSERRFGFIMGK